MFQKILIANRGEIACRVMATAKRLGVKTVAVYSDADANAKHVAMADEAVRIGPADVAQSYLQADRIIAAATAIGADAIHPGYGFLSENPEFVEAVAKTGLTFIGPSADSIRAMGLKDAAKALMVEAGVPVVPGYHGADQDPYMLAAEAEKIGYPVLIKARAGGGGKGMRLVEKPADFPEMLAAAQREGLASFGDPVCLIEKYITRPRHIEVQVFGDTQGDVVHLFERDCSLQRRHQKVIEEAPAPDMTDAVRAAMGKAAVEAAKAVGYFNAGTVEFIVDGSGPLRTDGFWFMEMNTRLQVEHPVSEAITGLDFVELQLNVAAGQPLPFTQDDLVLNGWSMEARVYAEDANQGFLPATGTLHQLKFPTGSEFALGDVRIDSGVSGGDEISPWYDPMIAKVIVHAQTREAARGLLEAALEASQIAGCVTNIEFLAALARNEDFAAGRVDTDLIARDLDSLIRQDGPSELAVTLGAIAAGGLLPNRSADPWDAYQGMRLWGTAEHIVALGVADHDQTVRVSVHSDGNYTVNGLSLSIAPTPDGWRVTTDGYQQNAQTVVTQNSVSVFANGQCDTFKISDPLAQDDVQAGGGDFVMAPMPGLVAQVLVAKGDTLTAGQDLMILEAMKMEHRLSAQRDGVVAEVLVTAGEQVSDGVLLLQLEPEDD
ncbi:acetyl/propionyl/methylcrotonyl-CoA carboxylase subunit alpha [Octadecabacter ascidiaceicola]|nr:biotin carboxylase N-terminal domain-containing protein [Octadecabacter ascidiaceicola]